MDTRISPLLAEGLFQEPLSPSKDRLISPKPILPASPLPVEFPELTAPTTNHLISFDLPEYTPLPEASKKRKAQQEIEDLRKELDQQQFLTAQAHEIAGKSQNILAQAQITLTALGQKLDLPLTAIQQSMQRTSSIAKLIAWKKKSRISEEDEKYEAEYRIIQNEFKILDSKKYTEYRQYILNASSDIEKGKRRNWQHRKILSEMLLHHQNRLQKSTKEVADLKKQIQEVQEKISDLQKKLSSTERSLKRPHLDTTAAQPSLAKDTDTPAHLLSTAALLQTFGYQEHTPVELEITRPLPLLADPNNTHIQWLVEENPLSRRPGI